MKTNYVLYALLCVLGFGKMKAADLYVRDLGAGGAYATISDAITAANDGDRIIIRPKTASVPYLENLTINKSLTFVSEINFSKYYIQGNITIIPAVNRVVTINNMYVFQSSISTSAVTLSGGRATINIINSIIDQNIDLDNSKNVSANVSQSSCKELSFVHGKITANNLFNLILMPDAAPLASSDVQIIANNINSTTINISPLIISSDSYPIKIFNNDASISGNSFNNMSPVLAINTIKAGSTNLIHNNRFVSNNTNVNYISSTISIGTGLSGIINIANNIIRNPNNNSYEIEVYSFIPTVIVNNNMATGTFNTYNVDIEGGNISNGTYTIDSTVNPSISTGAIVNAGLPDEEYQDLDLTRNDIGHFGGSNSWSNYWPLNGGNKPRVMFLNTPRKVYQGTNTIQVEATGISK